MRFEGYEGLRVFHVLIIIMVLRVMRVYESFEGKYLTSCMHLLFISHFKWLTDSKYDIYIVHHNVELICNYLYNTRTYTRRCRLLQCVLYADCSIQHKHRIMDISTGHM